MKACLVLKNNILSVEFSTALWIIEFAYPQSKGWKMIPYVIWTFLAASGLVLVVCSKTKIDVDPLSSIIGHALVIGLWYWADTFSIFGLADFLLLTLSGFNVEFDILNYINNKKDRPNTFLSKMFSLGMFFFVQIPLLYAAGFFDRLLGV